MDINLLGRAKLDAHRQVLLVLADDPRELGDVSGILGVTLEHCLELEDIEEKLARYKRISLEYMTRALYTETVLLNYRALKNNEKES